MINQHFVLWSAKYKFEKKIAFAFKFLQLSNLTDKVYNVTTFCILTVLDDCTL
jgi:hypothetical protein